MPMITGSAIMAGGSMAGGLIQGAMSGGESEADREKARNLKLQREMFNKWGLPQTVIGSTMSGYSALSGRYPNPAQEQARQRGMATAASLQQVQAAPGTPGYQSAKQDAYSAEMARQSKPGSGDVMGMMYALYQGVQLLNQMKG